MPYSKELAFGLDIGDHSLKVLQLKENSKQMQVKTFGELSLPLGIIENGNILQPEELSSYIKKVVSMAKIKASKVAIALPETKTFIKLIQVSYNTKKNLRARIEKELIDHIPYEINNIWWDFTEIEQKNSHSTILIGAAPKDIVESYSKLIEMSGLIPIILDLESLAIARALMNPDLKNSTLIIDIGGAKSTMIIATPNTIISTADARAAGSILTNNISTALKIEHSAAKEMKHKNGTEELSNEYGKIVNEYINSLAIRIQEMTSFTMGHTAGYPPVTQILLSGGGSLLLGLDKNLSSKLNLPVRLASPWPKNAHVAKLDGGTGMRFVTTTGLAMAALGQSHTI